MISPYLFQYQYRWYNITLCCLLFAWLSIPLTVYADSSSSAAVDWSRTLSVDYLSADDFEAYGVTFGLFASNGWTLSAALGSEKERGFAQTLNAQSASVDLAYQWLSGWSLSLGLDQWKGDQFVTQETLSIGLGFATDNWFVDATFRQRDLTISGQAINGQRRVGEESFEGSTVSFQYLLNSTLSAGVAYTRYQSNPGAVFRVLQNRPLLAIRLSDHAFGLISGQAKNAFDVNVSIELKNGYVSLRADVADNYFDDLTTQGVSVYLEKSVMQHLALGLEAGRQFSEQASDESFFSISAHYMW